MRHIMLLAFVGLGFFVGAGAAAEQGASTPPSSPWCLGTPAKACIALLSQHLHLDIPGLAQQELAGLDDVDVNGKSLGNHRVMVDGHLPGFFGAITVAVDVDSANKIVTSLEANVFQSPDLARTAKDYDGTGIYEVMSLLLGPNCMERAEFYRYFENTIKPKIETTMEPTKFGATSITHDETFEKTPQMPLCGHLIRFTSLSGYDTGDASVENPHGVFSLGSFDVQ